MPFKEVCALQFSLFPYSALIIGCCPPAASLGFVSPVRGLRNGGFRVSEIYLLPCFFLCSCHEQDSNLLSIVEISPLNQH